jgi:hypothetical protein
VDGSRGSSVNTVTNLRAGRPGFDSRHKRGPFLFATASRPVLGPTQPLIQCVPGALSPGVKRTGREADHSPPSSAEIKNAWSYISPPPHVFMAWHLVKHRNNFTFALEKTVTKQGDYLQNKEAGCYRDKRLSAGVFQHFEDECSPLTLLSNWSK